MSTSKNMHDYRIAVREMLKNNKASPEVQDLAERFLCENMRRLQSPIPCGDDEPEEIRQTMDKFKKTVMDDSFIERIVRTSLALNWEEAKRHNIDLNDIRVWKALIAHQQKCPAAQGDCGLKGIAILLDVFIEDVDCKYTRWPEEFDRNIVRQLPKPIFEEMEVHHEQV